MPHPGPPVNPTAEDFAEAIAPAVRQLAEEANVPLNLLNPAAADAAKASLRDHVSGNAIFGPGFVDDMATTGRFFAWPVDGEAT